MLRRCIPEGENLGRAYRGRRDGPRARERAGLDTEENSE